MLQVVVKEEWIAIAILRLVELEKCVVEGAGAAGLAAILAGHLEELKGKKLVEQIRNRRSYNEPRLVHNARSADPAARLYVIHTVQVFTINTVSNKCTS